MGAGTFCPNCGVRLIGKDWGLEVTGSDASEVESVASSLWAKNSPQMGTSDTGLRHDGRFTIEQDSVPLTTGRQGGDYQVVLLIHGIRTQADWGPMVRSKLEVPDKIEVIPIKYGYFDAFRFWFPFWTRNKPIERVYTEIRVALQVARERGPHAKLSIIAHSFGTYIIGQILKRGFDLHIHRLILCGSVLPQDFPWEQYQGRFDREKVINECGKTDIWPVLAQSLSSGYGAWARTASVPPGQGPLPCGWARPVFRAGLRGEILGAVHQAGRVRGEQVRGPDAADAVVGLGARDLAVTVEYIVLARSNRNSRRNCTQDKL